MIAEQALLYRICADSDIGLAFHPRIELMLTGEGKRSLRFIREHFSLHGALPSTELLVEHECIPKDSQPPDPAKAIFALVERRYREGLLGSVLLDAERALQDKQIERAEQALSDGLMRLNQEAGERVFNWNTRIEPRIEMYRQAENFLGGVSGIRSGWAPLDAVTLGWQRGEFNVVVATLNTGKTWFACRLAEQAIGQGKVVLAVTMEMGATQIARRIDCIAFKLPFRQVREGKLGDGGLERYESLLRAVKEEAEAPPQNGEHVVRRGRLSIVDGLAVRHVADLYPLIHSLKPDLVIIDSFYYIEGHGLSKWERIGGVAEDLKRLAVRTNLPVIAVTQLNREAARTNKKERGQGHSPSFAEIGFSYTIPQVADIVIALMQPAPLKMSQEMLISVLKSRESVPSRFCSRWDLDKMDFETTRVLDSADLETEMSQQVAF